VVRVLINETCGDQWPVDGLSDPSLRGLAFYRTGSLEQPRLGRSAALRQAIGAAFCGPASRLPGHGCM
jgi:hypothetical protein